MEIRRQTASGLEVAIIVRWHVEKRLRTTCYRGSARVAGNFIGFESSDDLLGNEYILNGLLAEIEGLWNRRRFGTWRFTLTLPYFTGWDSTAPLADYDEDDLEPFRLNGWSTGLRVKPQRSEQNSHSLLAPKTEEITIVFEFKLEDGPVAIIHTVYPGVDVGELHGNVTKREQRVFFNWDHPGA